jgi:hypothetical protein
VEQVHRQASKLVVYSTRQTVEECKSKDNDESEQILTTVSR